MKQWYVLFYDSWQHCSDKWKENELISMETVIVGVDCSKRGKRGVFEPAQHESVVRFILRQLATMS